MPAQVLELKPAVPVASVYKRIQSLKVPLWPAALLLILVGVYGYASGRQHPVHHYVPYVGYPLVLDTATGKACYAAAPKPADDQAAPTGPEIPMCEK